MVSYARFSGVTARSPRSWRTLDTLGGPELGDAAAVGGAPPRHEAVDPRAPAPPEASTSALRAARVAVVGAAALSWVVWGRVGTQLSVRTDIVGGTTFYDFDIYQYLDYLYIVLLLLPALAAALFLALSRWGPLASRRSRPSWPPLLSRREGASPDRRAAPEPAATASIEAAGGDVPNRRRLSPLEMAGVAARLLLPALVIAAEIEVGVSTRGQILTFGKMGVGVVIIYIVLVLTVALLCEKWGHAGVAALSAANAVIATAVVPLLLLVSASTSVFVASDHDVVRYPWLPIWVAVPVAAAIVVGVGLGLARGGWKAAHSIERWVLIAAVMPVALFLATAMLQGAQGAINAFDNSQSMVGAQLVFGHGLLLGRACSCCTASSPTGSTERSASGPSAPRGGHRIPVSRSSSHR